jgi:hypothetical protein
LFGWHHKLPATYCYKYCFYILAPLMLSLGNSPACILMKAHSQGRRDAAAGGHE